MLLEPTARCYLRTWASDRGTRLRDEDIRKAEEENDAGHTSEKTSRDPDQVSCHVAHVVTARTEKKKVNIVTEGATRREK